MAYIIVYFNNELKSKYQLDPILTKIGRKADNHIVIENPGVSGHHAVIVQVGEKYIVQDKRSTNGVYVNGQRITEKELKYGDEIGIFKHTLKFVAMHTLYDTTAVAASEVSSAPENATVQIDISKLDVLLKEKEAENAYLEVISGKMIGQKFKLSKPVLTIGKADDCDIAIGGWFTPKVAAKIVRQSDGYYLVSVKRAGARHRGKPIKTRAKLQPGDNIEIRGVRFSFLNKR